MRGDNQSLWYCVRQRAGPLVKECRALRPRPSANDTPYQRNEKNKILRPPRDSSVCRTRVDRLELRLALFCFVGIVYTLTFDPYHLPDRFSDVRKRWRSFLRLLNLWKPNWSRDYIYLIEGRHGDHRYHIHLVLRNSDFSPAEIRYLWKYGEVDDEPLLLGPYDTYRRTAKYWNKEASDGITVPVGARTWVASRNLNAKLPPLEMWRSTSGEIEPPQNVRVQGGNQTANEFGVYLYKWWISNSAFILNK